MFLNRPIYVYILQPYFWNFYDSFVVSFIQGSMTADTAHSVRKLLIGFVNAAFTVW
jgi:hypothetical protein